MRRRHTHVGAPDNRIEALYKKYVLTPRGKRHEPGTWTRGRRLTGKKAIISLGLRQRNFMLVREGKEYGWNVKSAERGVNKE